MPQLKAKFYVWILLIGILLLAAFLRFNNLPQLFVFTADEEYQTTLAQTIVKDFHIIWIGVSAANLDFYLGPFWTYFTAFWLFISGGNPLITGYIASAIGVLTTFLLFVVGARLFNSKVGLVAALLYASLPLMVFFDQKYWNPTLVPFLSLIMLLSLYETRHSQKCWIVFAIAYGLVFHTHLSLAPLGIIAVYWLIKNRNITKRIAICSLIAFIIVISPLLVFDYFHKFSNITTPLRINQIASTESTKINPIQHSVALFDALGRLFYLQPIRSNSDEVLYGCASKEIVFYSTQSRPFLPLAIIALAILGWFLLQRETWSKDNLKLLALFILTILLSFLFFPGATSEYYLLGFYPLFLFLPALLFEAIKGWYKYLIIIGILILCLAGIFTILTAQGDYGIQTKKNMITKVIQVTNNNTFDLQEDGMCHHWEGWRYLFTVYGKTPLRSSADKSLGWLYPNNISKAPSQYSVIVTEARAPINFDTTNSIKVFEGGFNAYVYKND